MRTLVGARHCQEARSWIRWSRRRGGSSLVAKLVLLLDWVTETCNFLGWMTID